MYSKKFARLQAPYIPMDFKEYKEIYVFLILIRLVFIQNGYSKYCIDMEVNDIGKLKQVIEDANVKTALILTEPLCPDLRVRKKIFEDIVVRYGNGYMIVLKPHLRDEVDYRKEFPEYTVIDRVVPVEMMYFIEGARWIWQSVFLPNWMSWNL